MTRQQIHHLYPQNALIAVLVTDRSSDEELSSSIPKKKIKQIKQIRIQRTVTVLEDLNRKCDEKIKKDCANWVSFP